jgi:hypothetical protein
VFHAGGFMVEQPQRLQWGDGTSQRRGQQQQVVVERKRKKNKKQGKGFDGQGKRRNTR